MEESVFRSQTTNCVVSGFRGAVNVICVLLGHYAAQNDSYLPTFRDGLSVSSVRVKRAPWSELLHVEGQANGRTDGHDEANKTVSVILGTCLKQTAGTGNCNVELFGMMADRRWWLAEGANWQEELTGRRSWLAGSADWQEASLSTVIAARSKYVRTCWSRDMWRQTVRNKHSHSHSRCATADATQRHSIDVALRHATFRIYRTAVSF
jgi:hypothetical protein